MARLLFTTLVLLMRLPAHARNKADSLSMSGKVTVFTISPHEKLEMAWAEPPDILTEGPLPVNDLTDSLRKIINLGRATIDKVQL